MSMRDDLDEEFQYYSHLIIELLEEFNRPQQRTLSLWLNKLSNPIYNASKLREKRNHYMLILCMALCISDSCAENLTYPFCSAPPEGALEDIQQFLSHRQSRSVFDWEESKIWRPSPTNETCDDKEIKQTNLVLDLQFQFILNLAASYVKTIEVFEQRIKSAKWIQALCCVEQEKDVISRGIRNDYMMLLSGYLHSKHLAGPFTYFPYQNPLTSLKDFCDNFNNEIKNQSWQYPASTAAAFCFDDNQPIPSEGAFAFIELTNNFKSKR